MASKILWAAESASARMTTELNALADNGIAVDVGDYANHTNKFRWADFLLKANDFAAAPDSGAFFELHIFYKLDGSNYGDGEDGDVAAPTPTGSSLHGIFHIEDAAGVQFQQVIKIPLSPFAFRTCLVNKCGQALAATGSTLNMYPFNEESQ
jgi:hypothetical protein